MKRIGFITSEEDPKLWPDDVLALPPLLTLGVKTEAVVWDWTPELAGYDALIFRSCWNYHRKTTPFELFLDRLEQSKISVMNSIATIQWNMHKQYLLELHGKGVDIPETFFVSAGQNIHVGELDDFLFRFKPDDEIVIKPSISMSGEDTFVFKASNRARILQTVSETLNGRDVLIQELIKEIRTEGELSFVFFNGEYSHAVRKTAAKGEFRVHHQYGGEKELLTPAAGQIAQAKQILNHSPEKDPLFARVDVVERNRKMLLMELELVDPELYLALDKSLPLDFAQAIAERI